MLRQAPFWWYVRLLWWVTCQNFLRIALSFLKKFLLGQTYFPLSFTEARHTPSITGIFTNKSFLCLILFGSCFSRDCNGHNRSVRFVLQKLNVTYSILNNGFILFYPSVFEVVLLRVPTESCLHPHYSIRHISYNCICVNFWKQRICVFVQYNAWYLTGPQ